MPLFSRCKGFSVTAAEISSVGGSTRRIRSPAQLEVNFYGVAANIRHNDRPLPSINQGRGLGRGPFVGSTNFAVNASGMDDCGGDFRYYAADTYTDANGTVHNDSRRRQSIDYHDRYEIRGHDRPSPITHNYDAHAYRGSTSRNYPADDHRDHHTQHNQPQLEPFSGRRYAEERGYGPPDANAGNGRGHSKSSRVRRTPYERPGNGNRLERPSGSSDYRRDPRNRFEESNRVRGNFEEPRPRRQQRERKSRTNRRRSASGFETLL
ncbi:hypothetical protein C8F04DRAFT_1082180 [Mycena alexandri]|uniref:Uncharacterized protein n=1 Tax=Mycena alexandri TaxID=1745969 RepID=A0AAD6T7V8_9AGAR|nr:hypothetical protein C8F04DRAFT_1082180 [Mycena alexandri]